MKKLYPLLLVFLVTHTIQAQNFLNGSFENTTAPISCQYNLSNAAFNGYMADVNAYGAGQEMDILIVNCYNTLIPDGIRAVGLADSPSDEIAMTLTTPLVAGNSYTISFQAYSEVSFRPTGPIQIGASTTNNAFGTLLYTGATVANTWTSYSFTFTAPNNATHITVRNEPGATYWNHADDFEFAVILPVNIQEFTAERANKNVDLRWFTEQELNNDYYSLQHSLNGVEWVELDQIQGKGTTEELSSYQYLHEDPLAGVNYYRLAQVDFDGNKTWSEVRAVKFEVDQQQNVVLYPNPSKGIVNIRMAADQQIAELKVINALGQLVEVQESNTTSYDWSHLDAGMYFIEITTEKGSSSRHQLILK